METIFSVTWMTRWYVSLHDNLLSTNSFVFVQELASKLSNVSMPLMDHFYFSMAPVDVSKQSEVSALRQVSHCATSCCPWVI